MPKRSYAISNPIKKQREQQERETLRLQKEEIAPEKEEQEPLRLHEASLEESIARVEALLSSTRENTRAKDESETIGRKRQKEEAAIPTVTPERKSLLNDIISQVYKKDEREGLELKEYIYSLTQTNIFLMARL